MADTKLSALAELAATPAVDDEVYIRDVSEEAALESKRITIANLMAAANAKIYAAVALTVSQFDLYAATGDFTTTPENINDGNTGTVSEAKNLNEYAEVDFAAIAAIKQWRQYGNVNNDGVGRWKIQYWDGDSWEDWETAIPTKVGAAWTDWASPAAGVKLTHKMRLVATTLDTGVGWSLIQELEVKY